MHRTEGDGYNIEGGLYRRFIDQSLPTIPGTIDTAEYNNAVQEELCNLVTLTGGTLNGGGNNGTAAADRAAGWKQCYDAVFQSGHMTDAGVDGITFSKISGTINLVSGGSQWLQDLTGLTYTTGSGAYSDLDANDLTLIGATSSNQAALSAVTGLRVAKSGMNTRLYAQGLQYPDGPGDVTAFKAAKIRKSAFALTGITWTQLGTGLGIYYDSSLNYLTDIPVSVGLDDIYSAKFICDNGTTVDVLACSANLREVAASGYYTVIDLKVITSNTSAPLNTSGTLIIEYDASSL